MNKVAMKQSINEITLYDNPQPRCPVVLLLDTSYSMMGQPIQELNHGLQRFFEEVQKDMTARYAVEPCLITFGGTPEKVMPFTNVSQKPRIPYLESEGMTPLGKALDMGIQEIEQRRNYYKENGISAYKPWIIVMSDGMPNDSWRKAADKAKALSNQGKLIYLGVGIGDDIDMRQFAQVMPDNMPPQKLDGLKFGEFFKWLSDSLKSVSQSAPGQSVKLQPTDGWAAINV